MEPFPQIPNTTLFLCGGAVRDHILGLPPKDRDFVAMTSMSFEELESTIHEMKQGTIFQSKPEYLTIRCRINNENIDIALPRGDGVYSDQRHPDYVERVSTLREDASRRDLTINSMFMDEKGVIEDNFGGREDLRNGLIRAVGDPNRRFFDDALRMLRVIRFACRFNYVIDGETMAACMKHMHDIVHVSPDRIREELEKAFALNPRKAFRLLDKCDAFDYINIAGIQFTVSQADRKR